MTIDTAKQQPFAGPILSASMPTFGASLRGVVSIDFDGHTPGKDRFIGKLGMQFGKAPFGVGGVGTASFARDALGAFAAVPPVGVFLAPSGASAGPLSNTAEIFNTDEGMRVLLDDRCADLMVGLLLQPSFSPRDRLQATGGAASAFTLQAFAQACKVIGAMSDAFSWVKGGFALIIGGDGQIADTHIDANHLLVVLWLGIRHLHLKRNDQIKLFPGLVIPQFGGSHLGPFLDQIEMVLIATIANVQATCERQDAHFLSLAQAVIMAQVIGQSGRTVVGCFVQSLKTFFRETHLSMLGVLPEFGPQAFIGGRDLPLDTARHLRGQSIPLSYLSITAFVQMQIATGLAIGKGILTHTIEGIAVGQLRLSQELKLFAGRIQFEFG